MASKTADVEIATPPRWRRVLFVFGSAPPPGFELWCRQQVLRPRARRRRMWALSGAWLLFGALTAISGGSSTLFAIVWPAYALGFFLLGLLRPEYTPRVRATLLAYYGVTEAGEVVPRWRRRTSLFSPFTRREAALVVAIISLLAVGGGDVAASRADDTRCSAARHC